MNLKKLAFWTTLFTTAAVPLATAQNPVILQGNYVSNVFGQSNFVLNPNAQTNLSNTSATAGVSLSRSTTTPLVATSEYNISTSSFGAGVYAEWTTRTFDAGMKNQNCEARFTYRGFAVATTTAQIVQGSNTVAQLTLTASTDPRIASINFPCGDLSSATTLRVQQATASLTGTNEIGGIYVGLATNQANVAQAEFVGSLTFPNSSAITSVINQTSFTAFGNFGTTPTAVGGVSASGTAPKITVSSLKPGNYQIVFTGNHFCFNATVDTVCTYRITDGTTAYGPEIGIRSIGDKDSASIQGQTTASLIFDFQYTGVTTSKTFQLEAKVSTNGEARMETSSVYGNYKISAYRFPTSSELVVTPERQNVWGGVVYTGQNQSLFAGTADPTAFSSFNNATWNQPTLLKGKAAVTTTNSGNDLGFSIPNLPVGQYKVEISGLMNSETTSGLGVVVSCNFKIVETTTSTDVAKQANEVKVPGSGLSTRDYTNSFSGVFNNTAVATRNFRLEASKQSDNDVSNNGACQAYSNTGSTSTVNSNLTFLLTPLDQPSNSALYVQGPVKASATGAAIPAGYVGQSIVSGLTLTTAAPAGTWVFSSSGVTLQPGTWLVAGYCYANYPGGNVSMACIISTNANTSGALWDQFWNQVTWVSGAYPHYITHPGKIVTVTTPTLLYFGGVQVNNASTTIQHRLEAVRLN